jgi:hypothetical protein
LPVGDPTGPGLAFPPLVRVFIEPSLLLLAPSYSPGVVWSGLEPVGRPGDNGDGEMERGRESWVSWQSSRGGQSGGWRDGDGVGTRTRTRTREVRLIYT